MKQILRLAAAAAAAAAVLLVGPPPAAAKTVEEIQACVRKNFPEHTTRQRLELEVIDRVENSRTLRARLHWLRSAPGQARALIRLDAPPDLRGAAYLVIENRPTDDMFMYMPAGQKVRRISSRTASDALWGTDFSYEDVKRLQVVNQTGTTTRGPDGEIDGRAVWVLELVPPPEEESGYARIVAHIDTETCIALRTEFYERGDEPRKLLIAARDDVEKVDERWVAMRMEMRDQRDSTRTRLRVLHVENDIEIGEHLFTPARLARD